MLGRPVARFSRLTAGGTRRLVAALGLLLLIMAGVALGQERLNFLAVDGTILDEAGPYYFVSYGDSSNAYAKAAPFADALDLDLTYDGANDRLIFQANGTRAEWRITSDVAAGLERRQDALSVNGQPFGRAVPRAILVDGTSYVAIAPLVEAFGGSSEWNGDARVIAVDSPDVLAERGARAVDPRIGRHDGFTRVAMDVPEQVTPELRVGEGTLALVLPGMSVPPVDRNGGEGPLRRLYVRQLAGEPALMLDVTHEVSEAGRGYRLGRTSGGVTYLDVGPGLEGDAAAGTLPAELGGATVPAAAQPRPDRTQRVVIDAGHGGHDPGTVSSWAQEKNIVLKVATMLADRLRAEGVEVILTRNEDEFLTLQERSTFATPERNLFVSIHANAAPNRQAQGIETWVFGRPLDPSLIDRAIRENGGGEVGAALTAQAAESADIAGDIMRETQLNYSLGLANRVQDALVGITGARDRGVRQNLFYVIRTARIPAILVELGFVSHPEEGRRLTQPAYQRRLADGLTNGVLSFLRGGGELAER